MRTTLSTFFSTFLDEIQHGSVTTDVWQYQVNISLFRLTTQFHVVVCDRCYYQM